MDLLNLFPVLSMVCCGILHTVTSAPTGGPPVSSERHVRTKRCSCATFLDKECVYFCHLDIIWVNTPERVVSYGLGNVPRRRRAVQEPVPARDSRCKCLRVDDNICASFCQLEHNPSSKTSSEEVILSPEAHGGAERQCKHNLASSAGRIKRRKDSKLSAVLPPALRAVLTTRQLLEKWRVRQRHKARAWEGESRAS